MTGLRYDDLLHDCDRPSTEHLPSFISEDRRQKLARWRCPECRQRWTYGYVWGCGSRAMWERVGRPSWRWRRGEGHRLDETGEAGRGD